MTPDLIRRAQSTIRCLPDPDIASLLADALESLLSRCRPTPVYTYKYRDARGLDHWEIGDSQTGTVLVCWRPKPGMFHFRTAFERGWSPLQGPDGPMSPTALQEARKRLVAEVETTSRPLASALLRLTIGKGGVQWIGERIET